MKYKIIHAHHIEDLETQVKELIASGWTPKGGVAITHGRSSYSADYDKEGHAFWFYQAMVLREPGDD